MSMKIKTITVDETGTNAFIIYEDFSVYRSRLRQVSGGDSPLSLAEEIIKSLIEYVQGKS